MTIWIDAQLSPALARWLAQQFNLVAVSVQELGLRSAVDPEIFFAAREANAVVLTKDQDFVHLLERHGGRQVMADPLRSARSQPPDSARPDFGGTFDARPRRSPA